VDPHTLRQAPGAKRPRKRIGRGDGSGTGTYAGRGLKGQKARGKVPASFEGGQMPLVRRLGHRRGFRNPFRIEFQAVNVGDLAARFEAGAMIDGAALASVGLIDNEGTPFKVLARGELDRALTVVAPRLSAAAKQAIEGAGGRFEELAPAERRVRNRVHRRAAAAAAAGGGATSDDAPAGDAPAGDAATAEGDD
jgi:large subunit ribosomal protein L15